VHPHHAVAAAAVVHATIILHPHTAAYARFALRRLLASAGFLFGRKPKVSVITPTWQRTRLLNERCRPSVAQQTYGGPVEHIVVSDGPDPGVDICLPAHVPEINRGVSARNHGVSLATGDILAYLDDDNAWRPNHLERVVAALDGADFAYTQALCIRGDTAWVIGEDPPALGRIDTSVIAHWRPALEKADWELSDEPPDWHLVHRWVEAGLSWAFDPTVTVNYYVRS
jgi:glycosyltransferase involved in cell wall biosynthesis